MMLIASILCFSCGKKAEENTTEKTEIKEKYAIEIDGIYEKDDTITVFYKTDGNFQFDKPINQSIKGSPLAQKIVVDLPQDLAIENVKIEISHNKDQAYITVPNISLKKDNALIIDGRDYKHNQFFMTDGSFKWDEKNIRYGLIHTNQYPPGFVGNDKVEQLLID